MFRANQNPPRLAGMDANELVSLLRRGDVAAEAPEQLQPPEPTDAAAALLWMRSLGLRPGHQPTPPATALVPLAQGWCSDQGWRTRLTPRLLGMAAAELGLRSRWTRGHGGYGVPEQLAAALWAAVGPLGRGKPPPRHTPKPPARPRRLGLVRDATPGELRHALVDSLGCVWLDAKQAAVQLRCAPRSIVNAAVPSASGWYVAGRRHWRRLGKVPEWLGKLPEGARFGVPGTMCWCRGTACMVPYVP